MEVLVLEIFVSLMLAASSLLLLAFNAKVRDHEHADRLALLPMQNDVGGPSGPDLADGAQRTSDQGDPTRGI